jgi:hypothetical protein
MSNVIAMKHRVRLLSVLAVGVLAVLPLAPAQAHPARATSWTREDPSFPFRWAPCRPIPYRVNLGGTSHRNLKVLKAALADVSAATGFTFEYAGTTHAVPYARGRDSAHQVPAGGLTIAWATPRKVPSLAGGVVGLAGPGGSYRRVGTDWQIDSGAVVLDKTAHLTTAMVDGPSMMSLILHELGHAMGLGHSPSKANVMYEGLGSWSRPHLGPGDRAGLRQLGASGDC